MVTFFKPHLGATLIHHVAGLYLFYDVQGRCRLSLGPVPESFHAQAPQGPPPPAGMGLCSQAGSRLFRHSQFTQPAGPRPLLIGY